MIDDDELRRHLRGLAADVDAPRVTRTVVAAAQRRRSARRAAAASSGVAVVAVLAGVLWLLPGLAGDGPAPAGAPVAWTASSRPVAPSASAWSTSLPPPPPPPPVEPPAPPPAPVPPPAAAPSPEPAPAPEPAPPAPVAAPVRIDAGGNGVTGWAADAMVTGGERYTGPDGPVSTAGVAGAGPAALYDTCRFGASFDYRVTGLPPGAAVVVRLHWAELDFDRPGLRVFDVAVGGAPALRGLDVVALTGDRLRALVRDVPTVVDARGEVVVELRRGGADNPFLSGLEVLPAP